MRNWRLLRLGRCSPFMNMAIDETILTARTMGHSPNTLRLYQWKPSSVSIGKNQKPENEVHLDSCRKLGVRIVRRISGGGTVYHDEANEITYSLIAKASDFGANDITTVYAKTYDGIRDSLRILGITADFNEGDAKNCPNLTVKGRKISGSSQAHKREIVLQHGTLLLDVDLEKMFTVLRVPWAKSCNEVVEVARNKITSLRGELNHAVSPETVANALVAGFKNALGIQLIEERLTVIELELAKKLCDQKYASDDWNFHGMSIVS